MAGSATAALRIAGPLARVAAAATRQGTLRAAADAAAGRLSRARGAGVERHPLAPAAVRVERARSRGNGERSDQTAVTVWFGQGPALPGPGGDAVRSAVRLGGSALAAAALAAMTVIAARREEARARIVDAPSRAVPAPPPGPAVSR